MTTWTACPSTSTETHRALRFSKAGPGDRLGKPPRFDDLRRVAGEDSDAVLLAQNADRGLEMQLHPEALGHDCGLIRPALVDLADAHLLQGDDIRLAGGYHVADPFAGSILRSVPSQRWTL